MRRSAKKHVLAILRDVINEKQDGMHTIIGCSLSAVVQIEAGTLKLSERLAEKISLVTGVDVGWLLANDTSKPPMDRVGNLYSKATWEEVQSDASRPKTSAEDFVYAAYVFTDISHKLAAVLASAYETEKINLCAYKLNRCFDELFRELNVKWDSSLHGETLRTKSKQEDIFKDFVIRVSKQHLKFMKVRKPGDDSMPATFVFGKHSLKRKVKK